MRYSIIDSKIVESISLDAPYDTRNDACDDFLAGMVHHCPYCTDVMAVRGNIIEMECIKGNFKPNQVAEHKALLEIEAIDAVRLELANAERSGMDELSLREIYRRLMSLYASLDVHNVESILRGRISKAA